MAAEAAAVAEAETHKRKREQPAAAAAAAATAAAPPSTAPNKRRKPNEKESAWSGGSGGSSSGGGSGSGGSGGGGGADPAPVILSSLDTKVVIKYVRSISTTYVKSFTKNKVNGAALCNMTDALLTELGVKNKFHRLRILSDVQREREAKSAQSAASAAAGSGGGGGGATPAGSISDDLISQLIAEQSKSRAAAAAAEEAKRCVVCLDGAKTVRFAPCNHVCCCAKCGLGAALKTCPMCRAPIKTREKLFFS